MDWDRGLGFLPSLGDGLLDSASLGGSNSLTGIVHMLDEGWVGLVRMCGHTGVAPCSTTDSGANTQAVMGCGETGHVARYLRAAAELRLLLTPAHGTQGNRLPGALFLQSQARDWCQALTSS